MRCRLCASDAVRYIRAIQSPYYNVKYTLYQCDGCESRFFDPQEQDIRLSEMYEQLARNNLQTGKIADTFVRSRYWDAQVKNLLRLSVKSVTSVLDIGCRTGDFLMHFDDLSIREGVELSENYAAIAASRGIIIHNDYQENIEFTRKYDIVSAYAIVEHVENPAEFLKKLSTLVSDEGLLIIMIPTYQCLKERVVRLFRKRWHMYCPPEHLNLLSRSFLDSFLTGANLTLVHRSYRAGGLFNPFVGVRYVAGVFGRLMGLWDESPFNRMAIFDHMYSVYRKKSVTPDDVRS